MALRDKKYILPDPEHEVVRGCRLPIGCRLIVTSPDKLLLLIKWSQTPLSPSGCRVLSTKKLVICYEEPSDRRLVTVHLLFKSQAVATSKKRIISIYLFKWIQTGCKQVAKTNRDKQYKNLLPEVASLVQLGHNPVYFFIFNYWLMVILIPNGCGLKMHVCSV